MHLIRESWTFCKILSKIGVCLIHRGTLYTSIYSNWKIRLTSKREFFTYICSGNIQFKSTGNDSTPVSYLTNTSIKWAISSCQLLGERYQNLLWSHLCRSIFQEKFTPFKNHFMYQSSFGWTAQISCLEFFFC